MVFLGFEASLLNFLHPSSIEGIVPTLDQQVVFCGVNAFLCTAMASNLLSCTFPAECHRHLQVCFLSPATKLQLSKETVGLVELFTKVREKWVNLNVPKFVHSIPILHGSF